LLPFSNSFSAKLTAYVNKIQINMIKQQPLITKANFCDKKLVETNNTNLAVMNSINEFFK